MQRFSELRSPTEDLKDKALIAESPVRCQNTLKKVARVRTQRSDTYIYISKRERESANCVCEKTTTRMNIYHHAPTLVLRACAKSRR